MFIARYTAHLLCDTVKISRIAIARALKEAGLSLDQIGSDYTHDIAYKENFNRHRNILPFIYQIPEISPSAYIAPNATVFGSVFIGRNSYIAFGAVARGDANPIRIG